MTEKESENGGTEAQPIYITVPTHPEYSNRVYLAVRGVDKVPPAMYFEVVDGGNTLQRPTGEIIAHYVTKPATPARPTV